MSLRRLVVLVALIAGWSATAGAFVLVVADPLNIAEHVALNGWRATIEAVLTQQVAMIGQMAQRLSVFTNLGKYAGLTPPSWGTARVAPALPATESFMLALNGEASAADGYAAIARQRLPVGDVWRRFGEDDGGAEDALRSALATIDIAASALAVGTDQTGRVRGNRHYEENLIQALEDDVTDSNVEQSTTAVLDKVSAAALIRARQQQARIQLLTALTEQWLVDSKRDRDTEVAALNMQLGQLASGGTFSRRYLAGSAEAFRTWRQP